MQDFSALGLSGCGPVLAQTHPGSLRQRPGWVWAYRHLHVGLSTNLSYVHHLTSAKFLCPWFVRLRPSFCSDPSWRQLDSGNGWVWAYRQVHFGPVMQPTKQSDVHHLNSARFMCPWFVQLRPSFIPDPSWPHLDNGQGGSGPIGLAPVGQCCRQPIRCSSFD